MKEIKVYNEGRYFSDVIKYEIDPHFCRETATLLATSTKLEIGQVLESTDEGLKALTSSGTAYAVLAENVDISTATQNVTIIARGAIVLKDMLIVGSGVNLDTACEKLRSQQIVAK